MAVPKKISITHPQGKKFKFNYIDGDKHGEVKEGDVIVFNYKVVSVTSTEIQLELLFTQDDFDSISTTDTMMS